VLYTIAVVLLILWLLGLVSSYTMGGVIHILLVVAVVMVLLKINFRARPQVSATGCVGACSPNSRKRSSSRV
jgi:uncharacterized protein (DUF58 family)